MRNQASSCSVAALSRAIAGRYDMDRSHQPPSSPASLDPGGVTHAQPVTGHSAPSCGHGGWAIGAWQRLGDLHTVASSPASSAPESVTGDGPREGEQYHAV
jgi:hypothetical protein